MREPGRAGVLHDRCRWMTALAVCAGLLTTGVLVPGRVMAGGGGGSARYFSIENGLSQSLVLHMIQDREGYLWFGTQDGLNRFDGYRFSIFRHEPRESSSIGNSYVQAILEDLDGTLWVGTRNGLSHFDRQTGGFETFQNDVQDPASLSHNDITALTLDPAGELWVGTSDGTVHHLERGDGFRRFSTKVSGVTRVSSSVTELLGDQDGNLWVVLASGGPVRLEPASGKVEQIGYVGREGEAVPSDFTAYHLYEDREGRLWMATVCGLGMYSRAIGEIFLFRHDSADPWSLPDDRVYEVLEDGAGRLWVGTHRGIHLLDRTTEVFEAVPGLNLSRGEHDGIVTALLEDQRGMVWVGTSSGRVYFFDPVLQALEEHPIAPPGSKGPGKEVQFIRMDRLGNLWIPVPGGGARVIPFEGMDERVGLTGGVDGRVDPAVGTDGRVDPAVGTDERVDPAVGTEESVDPAVGTDGRVDPAVGTDGRVDPAVGTDGRVDPAGGLDGCVGSLEEQGGRVPVVISEFKVFDRVVPLRRSGSGEYEITLASRDAYFSFEFSLLDYTRPEKNVYAFMMEGINSDWRDSGTRRHATYTGLEGGEYVFRLRSKVRAPPPW